MSQFTAAQVRQSAGGSAGALAIERLAALPACEGGGLVVLGADGEPVRMDAGGQSSWAEPAIRGELLGLWRAVGDGRAEPQGERPVWHPEGSWLSLSWLALPLVEGGGLACALAPVPPGTPGHVLAEGSRAGLTARELEVVSLLAQGASNKEIAGHLGLAEVTVKLHLGNAMQKTGSTGRTALAARLLGVR